MIIIWAPNDLLQFYNMSNLPAPLLELKISVLNLLYSSSEVLGHLFDHNKSTHAYISLLLDKEIGIQAVR